MDFTRNRAVGAPGSTVGAILAFLGLLPLLSAGATIVVDPGTKYQTFEGFGTSLCWW